MDATEVAINQEAHCDQTLMQYLWEQSCKLEASGGLDPGLCDRVLDC